MFHKFRQSTSVESSLGHPTVFRQDPICHPIFS